MQLAMEGEYLQEYKAKKAQKEGWVVVFYGISTFVGHLMPNTVYTYIFIVNKGFGGNNCLTYLGSFVGTQ